MSITRAIRASDCPDVVWKNGGGTTREIASFPPGAAMDDFLWRFSMAKVDSQVHSRLSLASIRRWRCSKGAWPCAAPTLPSRSTTGPSPSPSDGGPSVHDEPLGRPVRDLNAMVRRGTYGSMMAVAGDRAPCQGTGIIIALQAQDLGNICLEAMDCAQIDAPLLLQGPAICVDFTPDTFANQ